MADPVVEKMTPETVATQTAELVFQQDCSFSFDSVKDLKISSLKIVDCDIDSLDRFPTGLESLALLDLSGNKLAAGLSKVVDSAKNLQTLILKNNAFAVISELQCLSALTQLKTLDLSGCPVADEAGFSSKLFSLLPGLKYLDGSVNPSTETEVPKSTTSVTTQPSTEFEIDESLESDLDDDEDDDYDSDAGLDVLAREELEEDDDEESDVDFHVNQSVIEAAEKQDKEELDQIAIDEDEDVAVLNLSAAAAAGTNTSLLDKSTNEDQNKSLNESITDSANRKRRTEDVAEEKDS